MFRGVVLALLCLAAIAGGVYVAAGRAAPPNVVIEKPDRLVGQRGDLQITASAPAARLKSLKIVLEQGDRSLPIFSLDAPQSASISQVDPDQIRISRPFGKQGVPELQAGPARIVVTAERDSFLKLRTISTTVAKDIQVRLEPPRIAVLSTHHYVNHGGSEMVVYRVTPSETPSGVRVGDLEYRGFPAGGSDPAARIAFFALLHDQDLATPIAVFARDDAGNEATAPFVDRVFPKPFRQSIIDIDDKYLGRVDPEILEHTPELKIEQPDDLLATFLKINGDLRRINAGQIEAIAANTSPTRLWREPFMPLSNAKVEASFADQRTYVYQGREVDRQVHLGFDLAVVARVPVLAANDGKVISADWLGIYGNTVIVDHGMGVASLYAHLSSFDVKAGDTVIRGQPLGHSGMTGLAGGDHLHFSMLVGGHPVTPVDWWDPHWIQDRIERKVNDTGSSPPQH